MLTLHDPCDRQPFWNRLGVSAASAGTSRMEALLRDQAARPAGVGLLADSLDGMLRHIKVSASSSSQVDGMGAQSVKHALCVLREAVRSEETSGEESGNWTPPRLQTPGQERQESARQESQESAQQERQESAGQESQESARQESQEGTYQEQPSLQDQSCERPGPAERTRPGRGQVVRPFCMPAERAGPVLAAARRVNDITAPASGVGRRRPCWSQVCTDRAGRAGRWDVAGQRWYRLHPGPALPPTAACRLSSSHPLPSARCQAPAADRRGCRFCREQCSVPASHPPLIYPLTPAEACELWSLLPSLAAFPAAPQASLPLRCRLHYRVLSHGPPPPGVGAGTLG